MTFTACYGKAPCYSWENPESPFPIAMLDWRVKLGVSSVNCGDPSVAATMDEAMKVDTIPHILYEMNTMNHTNRIILK